jgi:predicted membrane protein
MAAASVISNPTPLLLPILVVALYTTVMICHDEFRFHTRCGRFESLTHRLLVFGNGIAWLAWMHWCFVRG